MIATLVAAALLALTIVSQPSIRVPKGTPITIDGRMSDAEWSGAFEEKLADGTALLLRHDGEYLYVGLRLAARGFPSVCVTARDTTRILHASAALGSGVFTRSGASWTLVRGFAFTLRSGDIGEVGKAAVASYLGSQHWVASNSAMSAREREMQIALSLIGNDRRLAFGYCRESDESVVGWPSGVADGCTAQRVVQGFLPNTPVDFSIASWATLTLAP